MILSFEEEFSRHLLENDKVCGRRLRRQTTRCTWRADARW
jgi:hypothetical protein